MRMSAASLETLADATPASRDRVVDFLRAASICAVVVGHWTIGIVWWQDGVLRTTSAIGVTSWLWLATWVLQVMPIFFFVGGFSNIVSLDAARRRGETDGSFVRSRAMRLLRPSLVFFIVWGAIVVGMHLFDVGAPTGPRVWWATRPSSSVPARRAPRCRSARCGSSASISSSSPSRRG